MNGREIIDQLTSEARKLCPQEQLKQLVRSRTSRKFEQHDELVRTMRTGLIAWLHDRLTEAETLVLCREMTVLVLDTPLNQVLPGPDGNHARVTVQQILEWELACRILDKLEEKS